MTGEEIPAHYERSDVCVVPAAGVIVEAMCAIVLATAALEKFGGDSMRRDAAQLARVRGHDRPAQAAGIAVGRVWHGARPPASCASTEVSATDDGAMRTRTTLRV